MFRNLLHLCVQKLCSECTLNSSLKGADSDCDSDSTRILGNKQWPCRNARAMCIPSLISLVVGTDATCGYAQMDQTMNHIASLHQSLEHSFPELVLASNTTTREHARALFEIMDSDQSSTLDELKLLQVL